MSGIASDVSYLSLQAANWGHSDFDGCNFCRRSRQKVKVVSDRHYEGLSCRKYMRLHLCGTCSYGTSKRKYSETLKNDDDAYDVHTSGAVAMEDKDANPEAKPRPPKRRRTIGTNARGEPEFVEDGMPESTLQKVGGKRLSFVG